VAIAEPGRARDLHEDQPGPDQGQQKEDRALAEDKPAVGGNLVQPGVFKVTLTVDGKEAETKKLTVSPDPLFK
jgi:hypothetical protein